MLLDSELSDERLDTIMASMSNYEVVKSGLDDLTEAELNKIITNAKRKESELRQKRERLEWMAKNAASQHNNRNCTFLGLPAEIRNRIYKLTICPEDIETQVKTFKPPALLRTSMQISAEFAGLYYIKKFMKIEVYDHEGYHRDGVWKPVQDVKDFQAILERRSGCTVFPHRCESVDQVVKVIETFSKPSPSESFGVFRQGHITWHGGVEGAVYMCSHYRREGTW